jgi:SPP1 family predicted phage head-tail adaptor
MNDEITLIPQETKKSSTGATYQDPKRDEARSAFANVESASMTEHYTAAAAGKKTELKATMYAAEYEGETLIGYDGKEYRVVRTYRPKNRMDMIELYCEATEGV